MIRPRFNSPSGIVATAVTIVCAALLSVDAAAQTNERIYEDLDFRFVTPGARAVGMGKTFVGLADDATAAESNPAGMSNLLEQEFSVEFIGTQIKHERFIPGGTPPTQTFGEYVTSPSFLSYVLPLKRLTASFYRHTVQDYRESFGFAERALPGGDSNFEDGAFGTIVAESEKIGVSGAFVAHPRLSIGGSWAYSTLSLASRARSASPERRGDVIIESNPRNGTDTIDADSAQSVVVGVLYKPHRTVSVGGTYHKRVTFQADTTLFGDFLRTRVPGDPTTRESVTRTGDKFTVDYVMPSRWALGASWRALPTFTVLADWSRINYSERLTDRFLIVDFQDPDAGLIKDEETRVCKQPCNFSISDVFEAHAGAEFRWYRPSFTMAFRGGMFSDPDHPLRFQSGGNNLDHPADPILNFRFNTQQPKTHYGFTAGWGIALKNFVQVDTAFSTSNDATEVVVSTVIRIR
jgi:long-chain fatty acid transport protein